MTRSTMTTSPFMPRPFGIDLGCLGKFGEPVELATPLLLQVRRERSQRTSVGQVVPAGPIPPYGDQAGVPEHLQVLRHGAERDLERIGELAGAAFGTPAQPQ